MVKGTNIILERISELFRRKLTEKKRKGIIKRREINGSNFGNYWKTRCRKRR